MVGADAVADGEDHVEVVVVDEPRNLPPPLGLNYSEFPNGCRGIELLLVEDVSEVLVDRGDSDLVQLCHEALREPDRPAVEAHLDTASPILPLVEDDLGRRWRAAGLSHSGTEAKASRLRLPDSITPSGEPVSSGL